MNESVAKLRGLLGEFSRLLHFTEEGDTILAELKEAE